MSSFLKNVQKKLGNSNSSIVSDGIVGDFSGFIDSGSFLLNAVVSGSMYKGFPDNKISMLAGPAGVGKSFILLTMISRFLQKYSKATVVFFESESAQRKDVMESFGIDCTRVLFVPITTVQELRSQALQVLEEYEKIPEKERVEAKLFLCLDSLGNLSTAKEMEDASSGKEVQDMTRAKLIKSTFRVVTLKLGVLGVPFICTNHIYMSQGSMYSQAQTGGGTGPVYNSSSIVMLSKRKEKDGTDFIGNVVHCKMEKSRNTKEGSSIDILINFSTGLSQYYGLLDFAVEFGMVKALGTRYEFPSGEKVFKKEIYKNPMKYFVPELLELIDEKLQNKFLYGSVKNNLEDDEEVLSEEAEEEDIL